MRRFLGLLALGAGAYYLLKDRGAPPRPGRAVAVGNSIVASPLFTRHLNLLRGYRWDNQGIAGNTTSAMLRRADEWALPAYNEIIVMGNLNDMSPRRSASSTIETLRRIYRRAKATGARVVAVTSTPWRAYRRWTSSEQRDQDEVNRWIAAGAEGLVDVVVDAFHPLEHPRGSKYLRPEYAARDGLHLNAAGQRALSQVIRSQAYQGVPLAAGGSRA